MLEEMLKYGAECYPRKCINCKHITKATHGHFLVRWYCSLLDKSEVVKATDYETGKSTEYEKPCEKRR